MGIFSKKENRIIPGKTSNWDSLPDSITSIAGIDFKNLETQKKQLAEGNAALFSFSDIKINNISDNAKTALQSFFKKSSIKSKNYVLNYQTSINGVYGLYIYKYNQQIVLLPVNISNINYDEGENITLITIHYESYKIDDSTIQIDETLKLNNNKLSINRVLKNVDTKTNLNWDEKNTSLKEKDEVNLSFIPVILLNNLPLAKKDIEDAAPYCKMLDIIDKLILLDPIISSTKIMINKKQILGNVRDDVSSLLTAFLDNQIISVNYDPDVDPEPISTINGVFKGKTITDLRDWCKTVADRLSYMYVPSLQKGAQQTQTEVNNINIYAALIYQSKKALREEFWSQAISMLLKFDKELNIGLFNATEEDINSVSCSLETPAVIDAEFAKGDIDNAKNSAKPTGMKEK